jgi:hypothetical protein
MKTIILFLILSSSAMADLSIYRGFVTTHLFMDNSYFNNDNKVTIIKYHDVLAGNMINSYGEKGTLIGWQPKVFQNGRYEVYAGAVMVQGYRRWQLPYMKPGATFDERMEHVTTVLPITSLSYSLNQHIALQANLMAGVVFNAGVRLDF